MGASAHARYVQAPLQGIIRLFWYNAPIIMARVEQGDHDPDAITHMFDMLAPRVLTVAQQYGKDIFEVGDMHMPPYAIRRSADWRNWGRLVLGMPDSDAVAAYFHDDVSFGVNLDQFFAQLHGVCPDGVTENAYTILITFLLAHEGIIHGNTRWEQAQPAHRDLIVKAAGAYFDDHGMRSFSREISKPSTKVGTYGACIRFLNAKGAGLSLGVDINEALAMLMTYPLAIDALKSIWPDEDPIAIEEELYQIVPGAYGPYYDATIAFSLRCNGHKGNWLKDYLQGTFLKRFVFDQSGEERDTRLQNVIQDHPVRFLERLPGLFPDQQALLKSTS